MLGFLIAFIALFHAHVWASEPGTFLNPPTGGPIHDYSQNQVYKLGETVQLRWATDLKTFSILLWQNDNDNYEVVQSMPAPVGPCLSAPVCMFHY